MNHKDMNLRLGTCGDARFRAITEADIVEMLLLGGWAYEIRSGHRAEASEATRAALQRWRHTGLPHRTSVSGEYLYDPVEVLNFLKISCLMGRDHFWSEHFVPTGRNFLYEQFGASIPEEFTLRFDQLPARQFNVRFERTFNLAPSEKSCRVRIPLPVEDADLTNLKIGFDISGIDAYELKEFQGRADVKFPKTRTRANQIVVSYDAQFIAYPYRAGSEKKELESILVDLYTRPKEGFIHVTPMIQQIAKKWRGNSLDPAAKIQGLWQNLLSQIQIGRIHYHEIDPLRPLEWALENRWCDCNLGSAIFVSLCRAINFPARIVSGYMLYSLAPSYHFWTEVWIDEQGWLPYDLLAWDLSAGGRDVIWKNCFTGSLDYRMKTQILPRISTGPMDLSVHSGWHQLTKGMPGGLETRYLDAATGDLLFSDRVFVGHEKVVTD